MKIFISLISLLAILEVTAATKYTYRSRGQGGHANMWGGHCGEWPVESTLDVYTSQDTFKVNKKGQPQTPSFPFFSSTFNLWSDCTAKTATWIQPNWDSFDVPVAVLNFPRNNKLQKGSASATISARELPCVAFYDNFEDGGEYLNYECDSSASQLVTVYLSVDWIGTGTTYNSKCTNSNSGGGSSKITTTGNSRDAKFNFSLRIDGVPFDLSTNFGETNFTAGELHKSTFTEISRYKK
ncbi:hypothetical protein IV203_032198 [Nitzschia inconspicua]|uniref:Uncharacterized protein n=1 Tax=Nitzschia inconspicua TaxID=303405 RepID=A0A9K3P7V0_9STRA|nr:hypothetical protein IV203_033493 [Nitzschia inconspicua]KAG7337045.1 hypothetical protein IV203_022809 [Nitzschia inconspicua]KAG7344667.1 hypothetical protein IV203_032198 [Nitzschia inconspicua]